MAVKLNKFANFIITAMLILAIALLVVICVMLIKGMVWYNAIFGICLVVFGIFFNLCINILAHEMCHLFLAVKQKMYIQRVRILNFEMNKQKGEKKFKRENNGVFGLVEFVPVKVENILNDYAKVVIGGPIGSLIAFLIALLLFIFVPNVYVKLFFSSFIFQLYIVLINTVPKLIDGSDASIFYDIKKKNAQSRLIEKMLIISSRMFAGETPSEMDDYLFSTEPNQKESLAMLQIEYARYLRYLDALDISRAKAQIDLMEEKYMLDIKYVNDISMVEVLEIFYMAMLTGDFAKVEKYKEKCLDYLERNNTCQALRVLAKYNEITKNEQMSNLNKQALKDLAQIIEEKGYTRMQLKLIEKL